MKLLNLFWCYFIFLIAAMAEPQPCKGVVSNFRAPYSGILKEEVIKASMATLPGSINVLKETWSQIGEARNSGLVFSMGARPLDDAVRDGQWRSELQH